MSEILTLYELNSMIRSVIEGSLPDTFLVTAEIASCNVKNHCYMTLVDKADDMIRAEMGAVIWANKFRPIAKRFEKQTGTSLAKGIKILFEAEISFHERYGLKLNIIDIDPSYTIGEMAVRRREVLDRLAKEGLIDRNKGLEFPLVPQRIGIISSPSAAGYEDLMAHLEGNSYGYKFRTGFYEAVMQGDRAEESIVGALAKCSEDAPDLDLVVIVRGGGGQVDLHCFDSYEIGRAIALLPLPVLSGIGHQRDVTVVDEVSNMRAKTPTAAADMIITKVKDFEDRLDLSAHALVRSAREMTADMKGGLSSLSRMLGAAAGNELIDSSHRLVALIKGLRYSLKFIKNEDRRLRAGEGSIKLLDPRKVLKRGYSITYSNGKAVRAASDVKAGDSLRTVLYKGEVISKVEGKSKKR
jgi:exodeoxyribonuclease VII large subunit